MSFATIILAAGDGKRMQSALPKPLHAIGGKPMLEWVMDTAYAANTKKQVIVTPENNQAINTFLDQYQKPIPIHTAIQDIPKGTGHAVKAAMPQLKNFNGTAVIVFADTPLITANTYRQLIDAIELDNNAIACLGFHTNNPHGYGRFVLNGEGMLTKIVEEKDATEAERKITFVNGGIIACRLPLLFNLLEEINENNSSQEQYLTDCIALAHAQGHSIATCTASQEEVMGINTRCELALAEGILQNRLRHAAMLGGATLIAPETVFLHHGTILASDIVIDPHVVIGKNVIIGKNSHIKSFTHLENTIIGEECDIGPYARLRGNTKLANNVKIGNFVETKNSQIAERTKASHLTYLGDSVIGSGTNIGAGTITCNYDGVNKHPTHIGDNAFIGSNTALVAPITIGDRAIIGAGSTITQDIAEDNLALTRSPARNIDKGGIRWRERNKQRAK